MDMEQWRHVRFWHKADIERFPSHVRYWGQSGCAAWGPRCPL